MSETRKRGCGERHRFQHCFLTTVRLIALPQVGNCQSHKLPRQVWEVALARLVPDGQFRCHNPVLQSNRIYPCK